MRDWVLHHMHLVIGIDITLHVLMIACVMSAGLLFFRLTRFPKPPGTELKLNILFGCMFAIIGYMGWTVCWLAHDCFKHYPEWWNR